MTWLTKKLLDLFEMNRFNYEVVVVKKDVLNEIISLARENASKEFMALLEGQVDKKTRTLVIKGLLYQSYHASKNSAFMKLNLPVFSNVFGSVHSHPGARNTPSTADLQFFNKHGTFHMIIAAPYTLASIQAYNHLGKRAEFKIIE
ncbi:MAG: Mov34/MPN/PAD-1 family protein [Candidatus Woesearchaeota archaeon]